MSDIHIAFASTPDWFEYTMVSICSILEHAKKTDEYYFYIMSNSFNETDKKNFLALNKIKEAQYRFYVMDDSEYKDFYKQERLGYSTNYRLKLSELTDIDKILYLDVDTMAMSDIAELYNTNINRYYVAGIADKKSNSMKYRITDDENFIFINAGVILMNLKKFREKNLSEEIREFLTENKERAFNDQDAINYVCYKKIKYLPIKYNLAVGSFHISAYSQKEYEDALKNIVVAHFVHKPWFDIKPSALYYDWAKKYDLVKKLITQKADEE